MARKPKPLLKILRGVHDQQMDDDVIRLIEDCSVVFVEFITTNKSLDKFETYARDLTCDDEYVGWLSAEERAWFKNHPDPYYRIVWHFRKSGKRFYVVDEGVQSMKRHATKAESEYTYYTDRDIRKLISDKNFQSFYRIVDKNLQHDMDGINARDRLVARQIAKDIDWLEESSIPHAKMALVQGYMHHSAPFIHELMPNLRTEEHLYNIEQLQFDPFSRLEHLFYEFKAANPDMPLDPKLINRMLMLHFLTYARMPAYEDKHHSWYDLSIRWDKFIHDAYGLAVGKQLERWSDVEIHEGLLKTLDSWEKAGWGLPAVETNKHTHTTV